MTALHRQGIVMERKEVHLAEPIKKLGAYQVNVKLHPKVASKIKLWIVKKK